MAEAGKSKMMRGIIRLYSQTRNWVERRLFERFLIRFFKGIHPKNIFNYRYEFFAENVSPEDVVIDIGCGTGLILNKIASYIKEGYGIDSDPKLVRHWKMSQRDGNVKFVQADLRKFDFTGFFREAGYNVCILSHLLEHIEDPVAFLKRINASRLLICVPSQENWRTQLLIYLGLPYLSDTTHFREYTRAMLKDELVRAGYCVETMGFNAEGEIVCRAQKKP